MIFFDVDGTLLDAEGKRRTEVVNLLLCAHLAGITVGVWTGHGEDRARQVAKQLGLEEVVTHYASKSDVIEVIKLGATVFIDDRDLGFKVEGVGVLRV